MRTFVSGIFHRCNRFFCPFSLLCRWTFFYNNIAACWHCVASVEIVQCVAFFPPIIRSAASMPSVIPYFFRCYYHHYCCYCYCCCCLLSPQFMVKFKLNREYAQCMRQFKGKNLSYNVAHSSTRAYKCWMCERACVWRCITSMYNYSGILLHLQTVTMFDMCVSISMPCHTIPSILLYSVDIHCFFSLSLI